jgi:hypothetical protein
MWTLSCNDSPFHDHFLFQSRGWSFFFNHEMHDADHPEVSISLPRPRRVFLCHRFSCHGQLVPQAKWEQLQQYEGLQPEGQGQNQAVTVLYVPCSVKQEKS